MKTFVTILFIINAVIISAQEKTVATDSKKITGVITDNEGMPIPGVRVTLEGTNEGVMTDFDGTYTINAKEGDKLVTSYNGMADETITISKQTIIDFKLREATPAIKTIVAPDTHAIKSVTALWKEKRLNGEFINMLQDNTGIVKGGCIGGQSGTMTVFRCYGSINGDLEPLYVIDGYPLNTDNFNQLNPNDIESIIVLKDAGATSIYGNRGVNGVIIVKTKNGLTKKEKRKLKRAQKEKDRTQTN